MELLALVNTACQWVDWMYGEHPVTDFGSDDPQEVALYHAVKEWRAKVKALGSTPRHRTGDHAGCGCPMCVKIRQRSEPKHDDRPVDTARGGVVVLDAAQPGSIECIVDRVDTERQMVRVRQHGFMCFELPIEVVEKELREAGAKIRLVFNGGHLTSVERA
jgi:hypothetical protein